MTNLFAWMRVFDDIRAENNGKLLYIGGYSTDIIVQQLPTRLPQLVFTITLRCPIGEVPAKAVAQLEIPGLSKPIEFAGEPRAPSPAADGARFIDANFVMRVNGIELREEGRIRGWVDVGATERIYAGSLLVRVGGQGGSFDWIRQAGALAAFYERLTRDHPGIGLKLAPDLLNAFAHQARGNFISLPSDAPRQPLGFFEAPGRMKFFFAEVFKKPPKVSVRLKKSGRSLRVTNVTPYSCIVTVGSALPESPDDLPEFTFEAAKPDAARPRRRRRQVRK